MGGFRTRITTRRRCAENIVPRCAEIDAGGSKMRKRFRYSCYQLIRLIGGCYRNHVRHIEARRKGGNKIVIGLPNAVVDVTRGGYEQNPAVIQDVEDIDERLRELGASKTAIQHANV